MSFSDLPLELIFLTAKHFDYERDINALVQTNRRSYSALNSYLYRHHVVHWSKFWNDAAFESVCKSGLLKSVHMLINEGMPLDTRDHGRRSIFLAAEHGHEDIVKYLLEKGVDPNPERRNGVERDSRTQTPHLRPGPFEIAIRRGYEGIVRLLVPHLKIVDYFVDGKAGRTPLSLAAEYGHLNLVKMLVEELKCEVEPSAYQDGFFREMSPLIHAACFGHAHVARYLLTVGANPNADTGATWKTALGYAVRGDNLEAVKALVEHGSNPDPFDGIHGAKVMFEYDEIVENYIMAHEGVTYPLTVAGVRGNQEIVNFLLQYVDVERILKCEVQDANFLVPVAAACGLDSMVQRLLEAGCDVNACFAGRLPARGYVDNALSIASGFGHIGVVRILLSHGADPNGAPRVSRAIRPLARAVDAGYQQLAEILLDAGADPTTTYDVGCRNCDTILLPAVQSESMFRLLLDRGADPSEMEHPVRVRLLDSALKSQNVSIVNMLLDTSIEGLLYMYYDESFSFATRLAATAGTAMLEYIMQYLWDQYRLKPISLELSLTLDFAMKYQCAESVDMLLSRYMYGVKLKSENVVDYLLLSATRKDPTKAGDLLDILLRNGVDMNTRRSDGHTCLSLIVCSSKSKEAKFQQAKRVIERGAKYPLTYNDSGVCLLSFAVKRTDFGLLELLLGSIEAEGVPPEAIEPHLEQAQASIAANIEKSTLLRLERPLQYFRLRRRYPAPVPEA